MNLPPPPPQTANQLLDNMAQAQIDDGMGERSACHKAARAIARLIAIGALEWWGMTNEGEPLFQEVPISEQPTIVYWGLVIEGGQRGTQ